MSMSRSAGLALAAWLCAAGAQAQDNPATGHWEGEAATQPWTTFLSLDLPGSGGGELRVGGEGLPATRIEQIGDSTRVQIGPDDQGVYIEGRARADALVGELAIGDQRFPLTLRRVPDYPAPSGREDAWIQDIEALETRFLAADRTFSAAERAAFLERTAALKAGAGTLDDAQIVMGMASAIAVSGNAHTRLYLLRNRTELRRLPIRLWWFEDGLYVVRATEAHADLLGCRVRSIGGVDPRRARELVAPAFAGNAAWVDYMSTYSLTSPEALHGLGVTADADAAPWRFDGCDARDEVSIEPLPLAKSSKALEAWWDLAPGGRSSADPAWRHVLAPDRLPLYLRRPDQHYWFELEPASGLMYVQFNRAEEMDGESIEDFGARLLAALDGGAARAVVLDLRFNTGGNLDLAKDLIATLEQRSRGLKRYVIIGRSTFSAGLTPAAMWREAGDVTVVGEPAGDDIDYWAEGGNIVLPNSGLFAHFANGAHSYSPAPCPAEVPCLDMNAPALGPDVSAPLTWQDYLEHRDPAMEAIADLVS
jgi:hypothetical protein